MAKKATCTVPTATTTTEQKTGLHARLRSQNDMSAATSGAIDSLLMETDPTEMSLSGERHPTIAELKNPSHPSISEHLAKCSMCRSVVQADDEYSEPSVPIPLDLPKGLVSENAFKWPGDPIARGGMAQIFAGEDRRLGRTV